MHDVPYTTFHLIGHSLGAHVAGYAGSQLNGALGRISGLDPAGPLFEDSHTKVRLDSTDALFVDVIHTNGDKFIEGGLGTMVEMGDADFYPNGGMEQPGCASTVDKYLIAFFKAGFTGVTESVGCSHMRVLDLFSESINSPCQFTAYSCGTVEEFNAGLCSSCNGQSCSRMGFHADPSARGKFYLETNASPPFCKG
ncbi:pancreatic lipase-related protein 3-like [Liolophura sinensis]|uniref:pancreatic lipase-related protein 3-like n=1 Tax=Liolophura sinensis TaxID=3198878 RepID=UPI003158AD00